MLYERRHEPLLAPPLFVARVAWHAVLAGAVLLVSLGAGVVGYHVFADLPWVDALENAAMILTGMGPIAAMQTDGAKIFASAYALYSAIVFISSVGVIVAPVVHRVLHRFHVEE
jgi:hypothetical protein